jgi:predicted permease
MVLSAAIALLLVIACVNVGNLLLLRATRRSQEFALRRALGATYGAIVRQLLVENALLAGAGGILGLGCAIVACRILVGVAPPHLPRFDAIRVAGAPLGAAAAVAVLAVLISGVIPAVAGLHRNPALGMRLDERSGTGTRSRRTIRHALVAAQVALALVMLAGAGLLARTLRHLETVDLGYRADHLSVLQLSFPPGQFIGDTKLFALLDAVTSQLAVVPGLRAVTPIFIPPFLGPNFFTGLYQADWQSQAESATNPRIPLEAGGAGYFRTFGIPIIRGRGFLDTDREHSAPVVVVSSAVALHYWPGQDPIGKRIRLNDAGEPWLTVVGVAGESHFRGLREATPMVYVPAYQNGWQGYLAIRTTTSLGMALPAVRRAITDADSRVTLGIARTMDDFLDEQLVQPRLSALLLSGFGFVALLLAAIGLYGVMASAVSDQTREIGVRMAMGATPDRLRRDVMGRALAVAGAGTAVGLACALATSRLITSLLYQVSPADPIALLGACVILLAVAVAAAYIPARRATRIEPALALRAD